MPAPNPETMSPVVLSHMDELEQMREMLDGQLGDAYDRVLTAGMKMLYAPENAEVMQKLIMDDAIPLANKLGEGVANLLVMMDNQGNGTIPKEVLAPVGIALLFEATDYLFELGIEASEDDLGEAIELMITGLFTGFGIDPKMIDKVIDEMKFTGFIVCRMTNGKLDFGKNAKVKAREILDGAQLEAEQSAARVRNDAERQSKALLEETKARAAEIVDRARKESEKSRKQAVRGEAPEGENGLINKLMKKVKAGSYTDDYQAESGELVIGRMAAVLVSDAEQEAKALLKRARAEAESLKAERAAKLEEARKECDALLQGASKEAEQITAAARREADALKREIEQLKRLRDSLEEEARLATPMQAGMERSAPSL